MMQTRPTPTAIALKRFKMRIPWLTKRDCDSKASARRVTRDLEFRAQLVLKRRLIHWTGVQIGQHNYKLAQFALVSQSRFASVRFGLLEPHLCPARGPGAWHVEPVSLSSPTLSMVPDYRYQR